MDILSSLALLLMALIMGWTLAWWEQERRKATSQRRLESMRDLHDKQLSEAAAKLTQRIIHLANAVPPAWQSVGDERKDDALRALESLVKDAAWWPERVDL